MRLIVPRLTHRAVRAVQRSTYIRVTKSLHSANMRTQRLREVPNVQVQH